MLDWRGELVEPKDRQTILLSELEEDAEMTAACFVGHVESQAVIQLLQKQGITNIDVPYHYTLFPKDIDEVASVLTQLNPLLTDESLYQRLDSRNKLSQYQITIGSTTSSENK